MNLIKARNFIGLIFGLEFGKFTHEEFNTKGFPADLKTIDLAANFPYYLSPYTVPISTYAYHNIQITSNKTMMPTFFPKNSYWRLKDQKIAVTNPFEDHAIRYLTIKSRPDAEISEGIINGCISTIVDGLMAGYSICCTQDPIVTATLEGKQLENKIPLDEEIMIVCGVVKSERRSYF